MSYVTLEGSTYQLLSAVFDSLSSPVPSPLRQIIAHLPPPSPSLCCPTPCPPTLSFLHHLRKREKAAVVTISDDGIGAGGLVVTWYVGLQREETTSPSEAPEAGATHVSASDARACASGQVLSTSRCCKRPIQLSVTCGRCRH